MRFIPSTRSLLFALVVLAISAASYGQNRDIYHIIRPS